MARPLSKKKAGVPYSEVQKMALRQVVEECPGDAMSAMMP